MSNAQHEDYGNFGFELCEFEPDACDRCNTIAVLYFGNKSVFDGREGDYWCESCVRLAIAAAEEAMG